MGVWSGALFDAIFPFLLRTYIYTCIIYVLSSKQQHIFYQMYTQLFDAMHYNYSAIRLHLSNNFSIHITKVKNGSWTARIHYRRFQNNQNAKGYRN